MKKRDTGRKWLRRLLKIHTITLTVVLGVYFVLAFLDPGLFSYDMRQKFHALADDIVVTATVLDPPATPVVTAEAECDESSATLTVELDWGNDPNTYTYDVTRDSSPLVSGLVNSAYSDTNVAVATTYEYVVTANGPMGPGFADSVPVSVTTPSACDITLPAPNVSIVSFSGKNVQDTSDTPAVRNRRPLFTGVTNMPNARIDLLVESTPFYTGTTYANANGYWEWQVPAKLSEGVHALTVTATDVNDPMRQAVSVLFFRIKDGSDQEKSSDDSDDSDVETFKAQRDKTDKEIFKTPFFSFTLVVKNPDASVLQGEDLLVGLTIQDVNAKYADTTVKVRYNIADEKHNLVSSVTKDLFVRAGREAEESFSIPLYTSPRKHFITAEVLLEEINISREVSFWVAELPLLKLSNGGIVTYADFMKSIGWVVLLLLFIIFLWSFLLIREFALYIHGYGKITERDLKKAGFFHTYK